MLGPHIFGCCFASRLQMAMMALQSASCSGLALNARYASTLAPVGLVLVSAIGRLVVTEAAWLQVVRVGAAIGQGPGLRRDAVPSGSFVSPVSRGIGAAGH